MKSENAIEVHNITKSFKVYKDRGFQLKELALHSGRRNYEMRQVLKGISFEVKKGEAIGLIGHNGCGKSTTLKLLTRIIYPDQGSIEMCGRVSSLIELGAGFHPDMSGRENIYINASIFGLKKKEIDERLDDIIAFSELEEFIDNPVRTYSSGMYMRLAFSVAINVDADILLIDEILAVGDAAFQAKCFNRLREIKAKGTTIVIVSHSLGQIEQICERSIWIHEGLIREEGAPRIVDPMYMEYMSEVSEQMRQKERDREKEKAQAEAKKKAEAEAKKKAEENADKKAGKNVNISGEAVSGENKDDQNPANSNDKIEEAAEENAVNKPSEDSSRWGSNETHIERITLTDAFGNEKESFTPNEEININIEYKTTRKIEDAVIGIALYRSDMVHIYGTNTLIDTAEPMKLNKEGTVNLKIDSLPVVAGTYILDIAVHKPDNFSYDFWRNAAEFSIKNKSGEAGIISFKHQWIVK